MIGLKMFSLTWDSKEVQTALKEIGYTMSSGMQKVKPDVSREMTLDIRSHFPASQSPTGRWPNKKNGQPSYLTKTGKLLKSIVGSDLNGRPGVSTDVIYAAIHNFGGSAGKNQSVKMPQREFMWLSTDVIDRIRLMYNNLVQFKWKR